jgi:hypothetical protein
VRFCTDLLILNRIKQKSKSKKYLYDGGLLRLVHKHFVWNPVGDLIGKSFSVFTTIPTRDELKTRPNIRLLQDMRSGGIIT